MCIHPFRNLRFVLPIAVVALLFPSSIALATNRTVTSLADSGTGTLRAAIAASDNGDTIDFSVTGAVGLTSGELLITKSITITGPGASLLEVTRATTDDFRIIEANNGQTVNITGLAITNGFGIFGAGICNFGATLTVTNCIISGNSTLSSGGGIYNSHGWTTTVDSCTLSGNIAGQGGGIHNEGTLFVRNSTLSGNQGLFGIWRGIFGRICEDGRCETLNFFNEPLGWKSRGE